MSLVSTALFLLLFGGGRRSDTRVSNSGRVFPWTQCDGEVLLIERDDDYYKVKPEAETTTTTAHTHSRWCFCVCVLVVTVRCQRCWALYTMHIWCDISRHCFMIRLQIEYSPWRRRRRLLLPLSSVMTDGDNLSQMGLEDASVDFVVVSVQTS